VAEAEGMAELMGQDRPQVEATSDGLAGGGEDMVAFVDLDYGRGDDSIARAGGELRVAQIYALASPSAPAESQGYVRNSLGPETQVRLARAYAVPDLDGLHDGQLDLGGG